MILSHKDNTMPADGQWRNQPGYHHSVSTPRLTIALNKQASIFMEIWMACNICKAFSITPSNTYTRNMVLHSSSSIGSAKTVCVGLTPGNFATHEGIRDCRCPLLTHWGRVTHICVSELTIIGSDNGLSPGRRQAIIWTNAGILLIRTLGINLNEILSEIHTFSFKKMYLKMSSGKRRPFCLGLNVLT